MAAKVPIGLRLTPETVAAVDAQARLQGASRQRVLETFVLDGLDDAARGVPDLVPAEEEPASAPVVYTPVFTPSDAERAKAEREMRQAIWARQQRLNEEKERASR